MIEVPVPFKGPQPLFGFFVSEWKWWVPGALFSFFLASVLYSGWPGGLLPNLKFPYVYGSDGVFNLWRIQRVLEGWIYHNPRNGYPFGSNMLDYPSSDAGNFLLFKLLGLFSFKAAAVHNLFILLSYPLIVTLSFLVLRAIGLRRAFSITSALLFSFLYYHIARLEHLFLQFYVVVPLYFYAAFCLFFGRMPFSLKSSHKLARLFPFLVLAGMASFGVYYAAFGVILLTTAAGFGWIRHGRKRLFLALPVLFSISFGVLLNVSPNLMYWATHGSNRHVAHRMPRDSEIYGLKMIQMLLPRPGHRIGFLAKLNHKYSAQAPLVNKNVTSSLGVVGDVGFALLGLTLLLAVGGKKIDERLTLLSVLTLFLFLFGTIGGLGALFAFFVSPEIRGWNRISIFISFGVLAAFFLYAESFFRRFVSSKKPRLIVAFSSLVLLLGLYDQTAPVDLGHQNAIKKAFRADQTFYAHVERLLPKGSAVYQLPYLPSLEVPLLHSLSPYTHLLAFVQTKTLRWSSGGMKWRPGDLFYRALSKLPLERQLGVLKRLGFAGIEIDRRGYLKKDADRVIEGFTQLLGAPPVVRGGEKVFFKLKLADPLPSFKGLTTAQIMKKVGYSEQLGFSSYKAALQEGIDFSRPRWPSFISDISGLSGYEPWGRWSDALLAPSVRLTLTVPLPKTFTMVMKLVPFGPNVGSDLVIKVGGQEKRVRLKAGVSEYRVPFTLGGERATVMEFVPPHPTAPADISSSGDSRKLGVGFVRLHVGSISS